MFHYQQFQWASLMGSGWPLFGYDSKTAFYFYHFVYANHLQYEQFGTKYQNVPTFIITSYVFIILSQFFIFLPIFFKLTFEWNTMYIRFFNSNIFSIFLTIFFKDFFFIQFSIFSKFSKSEIAVYYQHASTVENQSLLSLKVFAWQRFLLTPISAKI